MLIVKTKEQQWIKKAFAHSFNVQQDSRHSKKDLYSHLKVFGSEIVSKFQIMYIAVFTKTKMLYSSEPHRPIEIEL